MDSKELAETIERAVNVCGGSENLRKTALELTQMHRTLQQSFISNFIIPFIKNCAKNYSAGFYDARNEYALKIMDTMNVAMLRDYPEMEGDDVRMTLI